MSFSYRCHDDLPVRVMPDHIQDAQCRSISRCTLALMGEETLGVPVDVAYDRKTGDIRIMWTQDGRNHDGVLEPAKLATQILLLTDTSKRDLMKNCPANGIPLRITEHRSAKVRVRTDESREAEAARRHELARLRELGLAEPARPRGKQTRMPARRLTTRGRLVRGIRVEMEP